MTVEELNANNALFAKKGIAEAKSKPKESVEAAEFVPKLLKAGSGGGLQRVGKFLTMKYYDTGHILLSSHCPPTFANESIVIHREDFLVLAEVLKEVINKAMPIAEDKRL